MRPEIKILCGGSPKIWARESDRKISGGSHKGQLLGRYGGRQSAGGGRRNVRRRSEESSHLRRVTHWGGDEDGGPGTEPFRSGGFSASRNKTGTGAASGPHALSRISLRPSSGIDGSPYPSDCTACGTETDTDEASSFFIQRSDLFCAPARGFRCCRMKRSVI